MRAMVAMTWVVVLSATTLGCNLLGGKKDGDDKAKEAESAAAAAPVKLNANGLPTVPASRSNPPTLDEWGAASEVNTQAESSRPTNCYMKIVREWLKVHCEGEVTGITDMDGFGQKGLDYFEFMTPGKVGDYIVRLRKGTSMKLKILRKNQDAALFVSYPPSAEQPLHVALGIGKR